MKKSVFVCFILLVLHSTFVYFYPDVGYPTHQWQKNLLKAQNYLYDASNNDVIVGTSLSYRILDIPHISNLACGGQSMYDGLKLILSKPKHQRPNRVFIETNYPFTPESSDFQRALFSPVLYSLHKYIFCTREQYQPICLISHTILKLAHINPQAGMMNPPKSEVLNQRIDRLISSKKKIKTEQVQTAKLKLSSIVSQLEKDGSEIIFFEMPVNNRLKETDNFKEVRLFFSENFPSSQYQYLPNDESTYLTTDGHHLCYSEQIKYTDYFKRAIQK